MLNWLDIQIENPPISLTLNRNNRILDFLIITNKTIVMKKILIILLAFIVSEQSFPQVTAGLVGHFTFNNGSFIDLAGYNDCELSVNGDSTYYLTTDRFGNSEYAIDFQGAVLNGGITSRDVTNEVTVSLWMKTDVNPEESKFVINKYYCVEPPQGFLMAVHGDSVTFDGRDNTALGYMRSGWSKTVVTDGEWHHLVGLARAEGIWEIWVDAHKDTSNTYAPLSELNHSFCSLGIAGPNHINESRIYFGVLDDIRIYNRALDSLEIDSLFHEPNPVGAGIFNHPENLISHMASPNPFTTSTTITYEIQQPEQVSLSIFNHLGEMVFRVQEIQPQGKQQLIWNADGCANGMYHYSLKAGDAVANGSIVKVR